ncbi:hypothetical protein [Piscinibacter sp. XHJ-5]|uniref:hypothetical protein n=1 Tax=Piscinibacter sp. XHJ-5 TaxID=3037797 RepID=UPI0024531B8D|nr:hypothetical protein [Piscinibacter sp. XHJ-5]
MPLKTRIRPATGSRQPRRAAPSCRGGASSLLRLSQPAVTKLPTVEDLGGWIKRAAQALRVPTVPAFAPSEFTAG